MHESHHGRHALLIGIDQYPNFPRQNQLHGCVHDITAMGRVLTEHFRFPPANLQWLVNGEATRDGILSAMGQMLDTVDDDEVVVVHFSGHGSQVLDIDGDEADGYDETIVPYDSGRGNSRNRDITDDEIGVWLRRLGERTPRVTLIFDSCHSGTITRDPFAARVRRLPLDPRPPTQPPWSPAGSARGSAGERYTLFAACRDDESAHEMSPAATGGVEHGALSFHLCRELVRSRAGMPCREIFERVAAQITACFRHQHPQLEGAWEREIFGLRELTSMRYFQVCGRRDDEVVLAAGAAHGMTAGSRWAVYPLGTREINDSAPLGTLEVRGVDVVTAQAVICDEAIPGSIETGGRAVEVSRDSGDLRTRIAVVGPVEQGFRVAGLEKALEASPLLKTAAVDLAEVQVQFFTAGGGLGLWKTVDRTGETVLEPRRVDAPGVVADLVEHLERRTRYQRTLALDNPDPQSALRGAIGLELRRLGKAGWEPALPASKAHDVVFHDGDRLALAITHQYSRPVYIYVLDFGISGSIDLLYPVRGASEGLIASHTLEIGVHAGDELDLSLPVGASGIEYVKLFATLEPTDFGPLLQGSVRHSAASNELGSLLRQALCGGPRREIRRRQGSDWTTVSRSFLLRPQP